jgi:hypothetical protein
MALAELRAGESSATVAARYDEVFQRATESGDAFYAVTALWGLGLTAARRGRSHPALQALAAASAYRETIGYELDATDRALHEETLEKLRAQLGEDAFAAAWTEGRLLSPEDAAMLAVESMLSESPASGASDSRL